MKCSMWLMGASRIRQLPNRTFFMISQRRSLFHSISAGYSESLRQEPQLHITSLDICV